MPVSITCSCGVFLEVDDRFAGQQITCPDCQKQIQAPSLDPLPQRTSGLALASLVGALTGAFTVVVPFVAAALGVLALRQIARRADRLAGRKMALAGVVLGLAFGGAGVYVYRAGLIDPDKFINRQPLAGDLEYVKEGPIIRFRDGFTINRLPDKWGIWHKKAGEDAAPVGEDLVLFNPSQDAYVTCLVTRADGLSLSECKNKALREFREPDFSGSADSLRYPPRLTERWSKPLPKENKLEGLEMELDKSQVGQNRTYLMRVLKVEGSPDLFLLVASTRKSRYHRLEKELREILDSFKYTGAGLD